VTVHTPLHVITVDHPHGGIACSRNPVAGGAIDAVLDMDPMRKDDKGRECIHPLPGDLFAFLHVSKNFYCLGPLADRIARMAHSTELNVWNSCSAVVADVLMAKKAIQTGDFLVVNVIKTDGLIDRFASQNWEDREDKRFRRNPKAMPSNRGDEKNQDDSHKKANLLHHFSLFASLQICQVKIAFLQKAVAEAFRNLNPKRRRGIYR